MVSSPGVLALAVRAGHVDAADVHGGRVNIRPLSRSNPVHAVDVDGRAVLYVKQRGRAACLDGDDNIAIEASMLAALEGSEIAPSLIRQGGSGALWMCAVQGVPLSDLRDPGVIMRAAEELGHVLARLHCFTLPLRGQADVPPAPPPWPLQDQLPPSMAAALDQLPLQKIVDVLGRSVIAAAVETARAVDPPRALVHGDVAAGNIVVDAATDPVSVRLVDFELSGWGDPSHDLASAVATLNEQDSSVSQQDPSSFEPGVLAQSFLTAYERCGGPGRFSPAVACVRAVMTAWQIAATHGGAGAMECQILLDRAELAAAQVAA